MSADSNSRLRLWQWIHTWSSLVCTLFLLMLCVTGLPLIFHDEIDAWSDVPASAPGSRTEAAPQDTDAMAALVRQQYPARDIRFIVWLDEPHQYRFGLSPGAQGQKPFALVDARGPVIAGEAWSEKDWRHGGPMAMLLRLHTDMLLGMPGSLILAGMGALFLVSLASGVALYGRFMRKTPFGTVRKQRSRLLRMLDLHNLLGIVLLVWTAVVGLSGVINTLDSFVFTAWREHAASRQSAAPPLGPPVARPLQAAVDLARHTLPDRDVSFLALPGSLFSSEGSYTVFMQGRTTLTQHLLQPIVVRIADGALISAEPPPWYMWLLEGSRPLHFGNYGGLPLKLIWALLDLATIAVLVTGLYLYLPKTRRPDRTLQALRKP
ncbi:PepSY domain-containing protein [Achromobacter sp. Marseille-Q0513]|uniref:PepSY-associated TM helix domain-containing protein n=1 Tax=Achromobacter sp. Marseille-Q0513 TaxID=2829161 RepID=UPI001BA13040|nr:PepSY-associated TM helix domain-containing protein [Achromobacter sp. Marseille-Q0513]MBR8652362.1 PepSY domain-containing protein [Achromobacter sp. Marseille-Q0513]